MCESGCIEVIDKGMVDNMVYYSFVLSSCCHHMLLGIERPDKKLYNTSSFVPLFHFFFLFFACLM